MADASQIPYWVEIVKITIPTLGLSSILNAGFEHWVKSKKQINLEKHIDEISKLKELNENKLGGITSAKLAVIEFKMAEYLAESLTKLSFSKKMETILLPIFSYLFAFLFFVSGMIFLSIDTATPSLEIAKWLGSLFLIPFSAFVFYEGYANQKDFRESNWQSRMKKIDYLIMLFEEPALKNRFSNSYWRWFIRSMLDNLIKENDDRGLPSGWLRGRSSKYIKNEWEEYKGDWAMRKEKIFSAMDAIPETQEKQNKSTNTNSSDSKE